MEILTGKPPVANTGETKTKQVKIRALRPSQMISKKRVIYPFEGRFLASFGQPERIAKWFITGPSGSGKSSFVFTLCEYLANFGNIDYNSFEEGDSQTVVDKIIRHGLDKRDSHFRLLAKVPVSLWKERLMKRQSAAFGVMDSLQHAEINKHGYIDFTDSLCVPKKGKSMLFISHWTKNDLVLFVKHDCDIKIEVIGYVANPMSRYGGNAPFLIWEEGAKRHWGRKYKDVISGKYWPGQKK